MTARARDQKKRRRISNRARWFGVRHQSNQDFLTNGLVSRLDQMAGWRQSGPVFFRVSPDNAQHCLDLRTTIGTPCKCQPSELFLSSFSVSIPAKSRSETGCKASIRKRAGLLARTLRRFNWVGQWVCRSRESSRTISGNCEPG